MPLQIVFECDICGYKYYIHEDLHVLLSREYQIPDIEFHTIEDQLICEDCFNDTEDYHEECLTNSERNPSLK